MNDRKTPVRVVMVFLGGLLAGGAGALLLTASEDPILSFRGGRETVSDEVLPLEGRDLTALQEKVRELESRLDASRARVRKLESKRGGKEEKPDSASAWADVMKTGKNGGGKKADWDGKKKEDWKPGLPEGMTRAEQDESVRALVDAHDWENTADALLSWDRTRRGEGSLSIPEKETIGTFFELLGGLQELGVDFFDARVARRYIPARVSGLGADLDAFQSDRIAAYIDEEAQREASEPAPAVPLRYAHEKARDMRRTLQLEQRMASLLRPDQLQAYLAGVGDDPYASGFGFKADRLSCSGATLEQAAEEVAEVWMRFYGLDASLRSRVAQEALRFVTEASGAPGPLPDPDLDPFARRRAVLERAERALQRQGDAEQALLAALPLSEEKRAAALASTCPVLDVVIEDAD